MLSLRESVTRFFASGFFMNQFPPASEYYIKTVSNFFENSMRYSHVKVDHRYQQHNTRGKFATGINDTGGKFCHLFC